MRKSLKLLACMLLLVATSSLFAIPAKRGIITKQQSDGSSLMYVLTGDENGHHRETLDGLQIIENKEGDFVYAGLTDKNIIAHNIEERSADEVMLINSIDQEQLKGVRKLARQVRATKAIKRIKAKSTTTVTGQAKILIILTEYKDIKFKVANPKEAFSAQLNDLGHTGNGHIGSARDYFRENSLGVFDPQFDVVGPVALSENRAYYGGNDENGEDIRPGTMVKDACLLAKDLADFSEYDLDNDGYVDNIIILYAGHNEAEGASKATIWPHAWSLSSATNYEDFTPPTIDGKKVDSYACTSELSGNSGSSMAGIGTICHEFGHVIGLPDLYDTDDSDDEINGYAPGMGDWSLMDGGGYLGDGKVPPYLTAYERELLGWATVNTLKDPGVYTLDSVQNGQVYRINSSVANEYFLLENRQQAGWDYYLPGHGMLVTHVDNTNPSFLANNTLNAYANRERVDLEEADGVKYRSAASDPFPGSANKTSFTDTTSPSNSKLWNNKGLNKPIYKITETDGIIQFNFINESSVSSPIAIAASNVTSTSFTANWEAVEKATSYFLDVYSRTEGSQTTVMDEKFDGIKNAGGALTSAKNWTDINLSGWTGTNVYAGNADGAESNKVTNALKFGSSKNKSGHVTFPINLNGATTLTISAKDWATTSSVGEGATYTVYHDPTGGTNFTQIGESGALNATSFGEKTFVFENATPQSKIKIDITGGRMLINRIIALSGTASVLTYAIQNKEVGNVTSFDITDLNTDLTYYYVVRATDGSEVSGNSNEISIATTTSVPETKDTNYRIYSLNGRLFIDLKSEANIKIYNTLGQLEHSLKHNAGLNHINLKKNQVYIVNIDNKTVKIAL